MIRRRLFEDLGQEKTRKNVARAFADWCFERRAQLPPEWTAVDTSTTEKKAKEFLQAASRRATRSTRPRCRCSSGSGNRCRSSSRRAARWRCWPSGFPRPSRTATARRAREPLITLGSAPLDVPEFRSVVLGQLGESRLLAAIDTDIAGERSHAQRSTRTRRGRCGTSTGVSARRSSSSRRAARSTRSRTCPSCGSRWASRRWTRPRWTPQRSRWRPRRSSSSGWARTASSLPQGEDRQGGHDRRASLDEETRSSRRSARWSRRRSNAARASPSSRSRATAARCRTRRG